MKAFLKPARKGEIVRDPETRIPLPAEGKSLELTSYWRRRIMFGDVVEVKSEAPALLKPEVESKK